ncbi:ABC transporter ATP-binding protein [Brevibacterium sp. FAM 25378]|uniref:ABC transporter ATP-binding protein n=1 Tax=Brevibacterium sp. FAM 25378 TaxID=3415682 RepID=UPI0010932DEF|nr:ABC transporter ATP-binding protein [Brevibacterium sp. S22]TGD27615.1 ABC transporter ATP-binding protein [Brevibacterium sp. S22]
MTGPESETEPRTHVASAADGPAIETRGLFKTYGPPQVDALKGVSIRIERGQLVAVVGPSGSGKSTLLNMIGALDLPTSGQVLINSQDTAALRDHQLSALRGSEIGFVFQRFHLAVGSTSVDNVADGLLYSGIPRRTRRECAANVLRRVGLGDRLDHRPQQLSGGEQQRVAIARAIIGEPTILLADEPTGNLDSHSGEAIVELLFELHAVGTTVVVVTHDTDLAERMPRRLQVLDGELVGQEGRANYVAQERWDRHD